VNRSLLLLAILLWASPAFAQMAGLTHHGVPDFCASPTKTAATGAWNTSGTWSPSGVPSTDAIVVVPSGVTLTYDKNDSATPIKAICVEPGGTFDFGTSGTLYLRVGTLVVEDDGAGSRGTLKIGDIDASSQFTGTVTIAFDGQYFAGYSTLTSDLDPAQWNTGLIVAGKIRTYGVNYDKCVRMAAAMTSTGATSATLASTPTGWASGETLLFPESDQRQGAYEEANGGTPNTETATLSATVSTTTATFGALTYAHPAGYGADGSTAVKFPHVCNVSGHNIKFISVSPAGTRGHSIFLHHADVKVYYSSFLDMGRTTLADLNCSLRTTGASNFTSNCAEGTGAWTAVGTNQKGRYAVHFHHLFGIADAGDTSTSAAAVTADPQFAFVGNLIYSPTKWGATFHNTSHGLFQANAILECDGPCVMTEDGNEHYNVIDSNIACVSRSTVAARGFDGEGVGSGARETAGFWFNAGTSNYVTNNVACAMHNTGGNIVNEVGFKYHIRDGASTVKVPSFRGADLNEVAEYSTVNPQTIEIADGNFDGNECYAMSTCMTIWNLNTTGSGSTQVHGGFGQSILSDHVVWNVGGGFFAYPVAGVVMRNWTMYCYSPNLRADELLMQDTQLTGSSDYLTHAFEIDGANVYNCNAGTMVMTGDGGFTVKNSYFQTDLGVVVWEYASPAGGAIPQGWAAAVYGEGASPGTASRNIYVQSVTFGQRVGSGLTRRNLWKWKDHPYSGENGVSNDGDFQELPEVLYVTDYDGTGMSFEVYYPEQASEADAGGIAPCSDTTSVYAADVRSGHPSTHVPAIVCNIRADGAGGSGNRKPRPLRRLRVR
jgi:hypothetical protein